MCDNNGTSLVQRLFIKINHFIMQQTSKNIADSMIHSLEDYFKVEGDSYFLSFWISSKLKPYRLTEDEFQWIKYPIDLEIGNYRLCFSVNMKGKRYPIIAFSVIYPAKIRNYPHPMQLLSGTGFLFPPICITSEQFTLSHNISDFTVRKPGQFNICATTSNWTPQVLNTSFELLLLQYRFDQKNHPLGQVSIQYV